MTRLIRFDLFWSGMSLSSWMLDGFHAVWHKMIFLSHGSSLRFLHVGLFEHECTDIGLICYTGKSLVILVAWRFRVRNHLHCWFSDDFIASIPYSDDFIDFITYSEVILMDSGIVDTCFVFYVGSVGVAYSWRQCSLFRSWQWTLLHRKPKNFLRQCQLIIS